MESPPTSPLDEAQALRTPLTNLVNQRRFREAMALCERVRPDFPQDPWLATMLAYLHLRLSQNAKAAEVSAEAIGLGSQDPLALLVLGTSRRRLGRHAEAAEALLQTHRRLPNHVDAACMLLEETVAAQGLEAARPVYREVSGNLSDRRVTACWARLLFRAGGQEELPPGWASAPLMSVPAWAAQKGAEMEFVGVSEALPVEDPVVIGAPSAVRRKTLVPGYVPYACTLRDATIFSKSNIILMPDGAALNDTAADEDYGRFIAFTSDLVVTDRMDDRLLLDVGQYQAADLEAGIMLSGSVSEHFGHWVPEFLCRLYYLERHPRFAELPIIVDSGMPPQHLDYLGRIVPNRIVELPASGALRCRELVVASPSTFFPVHLTPDNEVPPETQNPLSPDCLRFIRNRVLDGMPAPSSRDRKLYLSRRNCSWRRLLNDEEISAHLGANGFETVYPEDMSFLEQVELFRSAKVIVAPNGSALLNLIFSPAATKIFVLSQRGLFNAGTIYGPMRELGYELSFICGDDDTGHKHSDFTLPLDRLLQVLAAAG